MTTTYTTTGSVGGSCDHAHRTLSGAIRCLERHQDGCASQGGYSDRRIVRSDGQVMTDCGDEGWLDQTEIEAERDDEAARLDALREQRAQDEEAWRRGEAYRRAQEGGAR
ncbi:MAG: hypothetical protein RL885_25175 [Planctomycetota bacterium]